MSFQCRPNAISNSQLFERCSDHDFHSKPNDLSRNELNVLMHDRICGDDAQDPSFSQTSGCIVYFKNIRESVTCPSSSALQKNYPFFLSNGQRELLK